MKLNKTPDRCHRCGLLRRDDPFGRFFLVPEDRFMVYTVVACEACVTDQEWRAIAVEQEHGRWEPIHIPIHPDEDPVPGWPKEV
jgi:hypothetical protein